MQQVSEPSTDEYVSEDWIDDRSLEQLSAIKRDTSIDIPLEAIITCIDDDQLHHLNSSSGLLKAASAYRRRVQRAKRYITNTRFPRILRLGLLGLLVIFAIHMVCIVVGMYQMSKIRLEDCMIKKVHLSGLDTATGHLRAEAMIPMPFMARFFHIKIGRPTAVVRAADEKLLEIQFPDLIVGMEGETIQLDSVQFSSQPSKQSLLGIATQHWLQDSDSINKVDVQMSCQLQTNSFWVPLDMALSYTHQVDLDEVKEHLKKHKDKADNVELPEIRKIRFIQGRDDLDVRILVTLALPPTALPSFVEIEVPQLEGELLLVKKDEFEEDKYLHIGKVSMNPFTFIDY